MNKLILDFSGIKSLTITWILVIFPIIWFECIEQAIFESNKQL